MSAAPTSSNRAREGLARWERDGSPARYVPATTMCLFPRLPYRLRARREGCEVTLRCYECIGCREFEALRLARRLVETYRLSAAAASSRQLGLDNLGQAPGPASSPPLFAVRIYCRRETHVALSRKMHRWKDVEIEPGYFRAGVESFIVLSREPRSLRARLRRRRFRLDVRPIGNVKRLRSWRRVARGLIVPRSAYGKHINRWYRRDLAPAEKENWEVEKIAEYKRYDRNTDARVVSESLGRLVPPEVLELLRGSRVRLRNALNRATSPEELDRIMPEVLGLIRRVAKPLVVSAVPKTPEEIARNREFNIRMARNEPARTEDPISANSSPPFLKGEVPELLDNSASFEERTKRRAEAMMRAPPPSASSIREEAEVAEASEKHRSEFLAQRSNKKLADAIARLRELVDRRQGK